MTNDESELYGIPDFLYTDNASFVKRKLFMRVMTKLGVQVLTHLPRGKDALEVRSKLLEELFNHERKEISDWAREQVAVLLEHAVKNRDKEARQKKIKNERFE